MLIMDIKGLIFIGIHLVNRKYIFKIFLFLLNNIIYINLLSEM